MKKCECGGIPILVFKKDETIHLIKIMCSNCGRVVINEDESKKRESMIKWDKMMLSSSEKCSPSHIIIDEFGNTTSYELPILPCVCGSEKKPEWERLYFDNDGNLLIGGGNILNKASNAKIALMCPTCKRMSAIMSVSYCTDIVDGSLRAAEKSAVLSWNNSIPTIAEVLKK